MNARIILAIVAAVLLALGFGYATASFLSDSGSGDRGHTMPGGQSMSGMMDTSP